jgi:hypothetical protein
VVNSPAKLPRLLLWAAWAFVIVIQVLSLPRTMPAGKDTTYYLEGAKSFAEGRGYHHVLHVSEPPIRLYPPGQSAFLCLGWRAGGGAFPENYRAMAWPECVASLIALWMLTRFLVHAGVGPVGTALSLLTVGLSPMWTACTHFLYSEPIFCALGFLVWERLIRMIEAPSPQGWLLLGVLTAAMYLWRTAALGMIAGLALVALLYGGSRRWIVLGALLFPVAVAVGFWTVVSRSDAGFASGDYANSFQDRLKFLGGIGGYATLLWHHLVEFAIGFQFVDALNAAPFRLREIADQAGIPVRGLIENLGLFLGVVFMAFVIRGALEDRSRSGRAALLVFAVYQLLVILWPYDLGGRPVFVLVAPAMAWAWRGMHAFFPAPATWTWTRRVSIAAALIMFAANTRLLLAYAPYAAQRTEHLRQFVESTTPSDLTDGQLAVDVDLPGVLVSRWIGHRIANLPFADEYGAAWVPVRRDARPPEYYLARTKLFDTGGNLTTVRGVYAIERKSPDGELALAQRKNP